MNVVYRTITSVDWLTLLLVGSLIILTVSKYFFRSTFYNFFILPFNNKYLTLSKKKGKLLSGFHVLLTLFQLLNISMFVFLARNSLFQEPDVSYPIVFWLIFAMLLGFLLFKIILQAGNGYFFENQTMMSDLIFEKLSFFNYSALIAFCGNVMLLYISNHSNLVVYIIIALILLINLIGLVNVVRIHQKLIVSNVLYFILYLCTLEIAPLVVIGSYLKD
ncbi:DUF4271 domain-containing protein [uncultured Croceitalea sp.]|uniref:DUF4271 domain-containing protein n=1 Tax=uncultured Croceitalea sp. TaxID=1798908 RepID=UPI003305BC00